MGCGWGGMVLKVLTQAECGGGFWWNDGEGVGNSRIWSRQNGGEGVGTGKMWMWRNGG